MLRTKLFFSSILFSFLICTSAEIGLAVQNFYLVDSSVRNVKLSWNSVPGVTTYLVHRKSSSSSYQVVAKLNATSYDDYDIPAGPHTYQVSSVGSVAETSNEFTTNPPERGALKNMKTYDNTKPSQLEIRSKIRVGKTLYRYAFHSDTNGAKEITEASSADGYTFSKERVVLTRKQICALGIAGFCKLESLSFLQHPNTSEVVLWAHWEELHGYGKGNVGVAFGQPGGNWTFEGSFRPLGYDSRDLNFFAGDDGSGYIISSTHKNSDMNIYKLSEDWHKVQTLVATVLKGEFREAPAMIRHDDTYYLFTSKAAGWYPSPGKYISSKKISGPWSESRFIGNLGGFSAQSGGIVKLGSSWAMCANQWQTSPQGPPHRQIFLPITLLDGYATYYLYSSVLYLDDDDRGGVYGIQNGNILSIGKNVMSSGHVLGYPVTNAVQGINTNPQSFYKPPSVPFTIRIDLGAPHRLTQIDLTTVSPGGSETAYKFTLEAGPSAHGSFETILDASNNVQVGFYRSPIAPRDHVQFVILNVTQVVYVHNLHNSSQVGVYEFTVYGQK